MNRPEIRTVLRPSERPTVAMVAYAIAVLAWLALLLHDPVEASLGSHGHAMPLDATAPGVAEAVALTDGVGGVVHYLGMWGLMMVAMMYPSTADVFQRFADRSSAGHPAGTGSDVVAFVGAYTLLWVLVGLVPLIVAAVVPIAILAAAWGSLYLGVALLFVGAFQASPVKRRYLGRCRFPSTVLAEGSRPGIASAVRAGWDFGRLDVGSCGVLMGLMVVVGSMNLVWMLVITVVLVLERMTAGGYRWARLSGALAAATGVVLVVAWFV
ncbi:DUF2182 domain-containing protein [Haloarchaeobius sp. HRN-SO-5]|uniref:DUF2182 domain-containing protein n=1 Tax=Haloarchaeobius sp. HRN-SO-5 TaxID=3446118 RepID=UPI003EC0CAE0